MKIRKYYFLIAYLLLISGCYKVNIESEFETLQKKTNKVTESQIILDNVLHEDLSDIPSIKNKVNEGLSKQEAISIALLNNPKLQADFENLGIAKADLVQAGLYTNPSISSVFRFPTKSQGPGTAQTNIESIASFRLSDLWHVPLSRHVKEDILEMVSLRILSTILTIISETKIAYDSCLKAELQLNNIKNLIKVTKDLRDEIYYRQNYGYGTDLDKFNADSLVSFLDVELQQLQADKLFSYIHLKKLLGIDPSTITIKLIDSLKNNLDLPSIKILEEYALKSRPDIQIARMKIKQYKHTLTLEKSKIFKDIDIGIAYKQDFDKPFRGWGPYINFSLPVFDINSAHIAKAQFFLKQSEKELIEAKINIKEEIRKPYEILKALKQEIAYYKNVILPLNKKSIEYSYTYAKTMQLNMITAIESKIKFYKTKMELIDKYFHANKEFAQLERAVGKNIQLFDNYLQNN